MECCCKSFTKGREWKKNVKINTLPGQGKLKQEWKPPKKWFWIKIMKRNQKMYFGL
jgi:hypothetical protein